MRWSDDRAWGRDDCYPYYKIPCYATRGFHDDSNERKQRNIDEQTKEKECKIKNENDRVKKIKSLMYEKL